VRGVPGAGAGGSAATTATAQHPTNNTHSRRTMQSAPVASVEPNPPPMRGHACR
jgi:hypothetical protein